MADWLFSRYSNFHRCIPSRDGTKRREVNSGLHVEENETLGLHMELLSVQDCETKVRLLIFRTSWLRSFFPTLLVVVCPLHLHAIICNDIYPSIRLPPAMTMALALGDVLPHFQHHHNKQGQASLTHYWIIVNSPAHVARHHGRLSPGRQRHRHRQSTPLRR